MRPAALVALCVLVAACDDDRIRDREYGRVVYDVFPETAKGAPLDDFGIPAAFVMSVGFANDTAFDYLDLGSLTPTEDLANETFRIAIPKIYVLERDGDPVEGQWPILDTLPDDFEYNAFWQIVKVEVDGDYEANDIKSLKSLEKADFEITDTHQAMYCPVLNPDALFLTSDLGVQLNVFPGNGEVIPNLAYDPGADPGDADTPVLEESDATPEDIVLQPFWQKRLLGFCWELDPDRRFPTEHVTIAGFEYEVLKDEAFSTRFDQYQGDEMTGPTEPWGTAPIFEAGIGSSPARQVLAVVTASGDQVTSASALDPSMAALVDFANNLIVRETPPAPPAEEE